ncbi:MAG: hypothetical protein ACXVBW_03350 [Bdellovibrionota bacterium]
MTKSHRDEKKKYSELADIVREVINKSDPYSLLAGGSPPDEFDSEISKIVPEAIKPSTNREFAAHIAKVFGDSFGHKDFTVENCLGMADEIRSKLKRKGLLKP